MSGIGVNLRVTGHCNQGGRKYMEDMFSVAYQQTEDLNDLEYAFFGIFDGHGGVEAATYAKEHLLDSIVQQKSFWSDNDDDVLHAIHEGYIQTHQAMWKEQANWQRTQSGLPSTSGTTATVAFIMKSKIYVGHVGDSMLVLGYHDENDKMWKCLELTKEHKPECPEEIKRITKAGGKVVRKNGVPRVVWNRPKIGHKGPVRRSTAFDEIPFLAVARSLGDFWSYNSELDKFVVSPEPDVGVIEMDTTQHKCLIFGTDGLWNMLSAQDAVDIVHFTEMRNEQTEQTQSNNWINPSKCLVDEAIEKWRVSRTRADNTSVVTLLIDPPGPPPRPKTIKPEPGCESETSRLDGDEEPPLLPTSGGMAIFTRSPGSPKQELLNNLFKQSASVSSSSSVCSNKNRMISNILRPYEQLMKSKSSSSPSTSSPSLSSPSSSCSSSAPQVSPAHSTTGSTSSDSTNHNSVSSDSTNQNSTSSDSTNESVASSTRSGHQSASNSVSSDSTNQNVASSTRSGHQAANLVDSTNQNVSSSTKSGHQSASLISTRSVHSVTNSASVSNTRSVNASPNAVSSRNGHTDPSASVPNHISTRSVSQDTASISSRSDHSSASVVNSSRSSHQTVSIASGVVRGGEGRSGRSLTKALTNQTTVLTSTKRKRLRMDEKRSSLPLNMGFEESSGNSDTENERLSVSPQPTPNTKTQLKKQRVETNRSLMTNSPPLTAAAASTSTASSASHPSSTMSTRTLRSDTIAAIPVKTLRSRNVNMSSPTTGGYTPSPNVNCGGSPRSKSLTSSSSSLSSSTSTSGGAVASKKLRWNKR